MLKKLIALLTVFAVTAAFAACAKDEGESTTTTEVTTDAAESETVIPGTIVPTRVVETTEEETTELNFTFSKTAAQKLGSFNSDIFGSLTLYLQDGMIAIFDEFETMKFVLSAEGYDPAKVSEGVLLEGEDMNFDGHTDFRLLYSLENSNGYFHCWLWNRNTKTFEYYSPLSAISSPTFDADVSSVTSYMRATATTNKITVYEWQNGELMPVSNRTVEDATQPGAEIVDTSAVISDGEALASVKLTGRVNSASRWLCKIENENLVTLYSDTYDSTAAEYTFLFKGLKPGITTVVFRFVPVWDADYVSEKIINITVDSDLALHITEIQ